MAKQYPHNTWVWTEALNSPTTACLHQVLYVGPIALDHSRYADGLHVRYGPVDHGWRKLSELVDDGVFQLAGRPGITWVDAGLEEPPQKKI